MARILWIILIVILAIWLVGFLLDFAGGLIHLLLIVAVVILLINLFTGRKGV
ncbi:lmo0937 family membrane protein [Indiicoccus explosivorum]|uniref:lmo0937 family membrane protein n=1 Tax=Indiicoccus explosivorum TaxID=1917864 RepID=UPI0011849A09|nr:lmo0937 family membrane protein [Indiicoccus explosivorum]